MLVLCYFLCTESNQRNFIEKSLFTFALAKISLWLVKISLVYEFHFWRSQKFHCKPLACLVGPSGLEPPTSCLSGTRSNLLSYEPMWLVWILFTLRFCSLCLEASLLTFLLEESKWWRCWDSNPWPPACRAGALPAELHPHLIGFCFFSILPFWKLFAYFFSKK